MPSDAILSFEYCSFHMIKKFFITVSLFKHTVCINYFTQNSVRIFFAVTETKS